MSTQGKSKPATEENSQNNPINYPNSPQTAALEPAPVDDSPEAYALKAAVIAHLAGHFDVEPAALPALVIDGKLHPFQLPAPDDKPPRDAWYVLYPYGFAAVWYGSGKDVWRWPHIDPTTDEDRQAFDDRAADVMAQWHPTQPAPKAEAPARKRKGA